MNNNDDELEHYDPTAKSPYTPQDSSDLPSFGVPAMPTVPLKTRNITPEELYPSPPKEFNPKQQPTSTSLHETKNFHPKPIPPRNPSSN